MITLITVAIEALGKALDIVGYKQATTWQMQATRLQLDIQAEEGKGFNADDAKLESMYKQLKIVLEAARSEIYATAARK